jgi:dihydroorotate dehydrogenase
VTGYRWVFDHLLVRTDAETAHRAAFAALRLAARAPAPRRSRRRPTEVQAMGLRFAGPLGLAAGFDKSAVGIDALARLGFSFVEVGTVTGRAQPGNPRPRLFRLPQDRAIVNRMGFNNDGAGRVAARLAARQRRLVHRDHRLALRARSSDRHPDGPGADPTELPVVVGVNIGKTKAVPGDDEQAVLADYRMSTRLLAPYADYLVVNVSSPNTPGLRDLQEVGRLRPLLEAVRRTADAATQRRVPLLVKIAPDLSDEDVLAVADLVGALRLDGVVATNTTVDRTGLRSSAEEVAAVGDGGVSGPPVAQRSLAVLRLLRSRLGESATLISVGGVSSVEHARERLAAGATLLQVYTALVYEGPAWVARTQRALGPTQRDSEIR